MELPGLIKRSVERRCWSRHVFCTCVYSRVVGGVGVRACVAGDEDATYPGCDPRVQTT